MHLPPNKKPITMIDKIEITLIKQGVHIKEFDTKSEKNTPTELACDNTLIVVDEEGTFTMERLAFFLNKHWFLGKYKGVIEELTIKIKPPTHATT